MIIDFSVSNFGPIREEQTISFEATADETLSDYYLAEPIPGLKLLKLLILYGPNASGKSTFLSALKFLRTLSTNPAQGKYDKLRFEPFFFDNVSQLEPSSIKINFVANSIRHNYEVRFTNYSVLSERLFYAPKGRMAELFTRETDMDNQVSKVTFGGTVAIGSKEIDLIEGNTIWNNTVIGALNKTNVKVPELQNVLNWFRETFMTEVNPKTDLFSRTTKMIDEDASFKESIIEIIKRADIQISGLEVEILDQKMSGDMFSKLRAMFSAEEVRDFQENTPKRMNLTFKHTVKNSEGEFTSFELPRQLESTGTMRYYGLSGILSTLIKGNKIATIDELETSLHPEIMKHFLLLFLANAGSSQMLITTHNIFLLDERDILRNDAIWFTQKTENGTTESYSLSDFDTSIIRKQSSIINSYKTGKLGAKPDPGNIFINEEDGQN